MLSCSGGITVVSSSKQKQTYIQTKTKQKTGPEKIQQLYVYVVTV